MRHLLFVAALAAATHAQTVTREDAAGNTVVEVVTTDLLGNPLTSTIQTLAATTTGTTSTPTTTTTQPIVQQGPVGQPDATSFSPGGPTPYTYTTVVNGVTTALVDTFIPTNPATQAITVGASGTILDYSSWLAEYGPTTTAKSGANGAMGARQPRSGFAATLVPVGLAVGMGLVLH
ncbi:hypothetical protein H0H87_002560 [Tephrocybe sp. NHM501043]|nr:hypothetical protein H0H87_002560 [Tephrocybe sp. NHM501043]